MGRLDGKVAAITGGASGIGAGTVRRFAEEGAKVLIADLDTDKGQALAAELGSATAFLRTDVSKEEDVAAMIAETTDRFGRIDVLYNNAGVMLSDESSSPVSVYVPSVLSVSAESVASTARVSGTPGIRRYRMNANR